MTKIKVTGLTQGKEERKHYQTDTVRALKEILILSNENQLYLVSC